MSAGDSKRHRDDEIDRATSTEPPGFFASGNVWVLIPLAGISIPLTAILSNSDGPLIWVLAAIAIIAAVTMAGRNVIQLRHRLRMQELAARERLALAERERYTAVDRMLEREGVQDLTAERHRLDP